MRKPRVRANGQGTVVKRRADRFDAVLVVGWTLEGKPVRRSRSASSDQGAKALLAAMVKARDQGDPLPDPRLTSATYLRRWLELVGPRVRPSTLRAYRFVLGRFVLPSVGAVPLRALRARHVTAMLDGMAHLSPHTAAAARSVLRRALADAERDRLVDHNAAALAHGPSVAGIRPDVPSALDVRAVLVALSEHRLSALFVLTATTGLRLGEVTGLRSTDIVGALLHVRVQLQATRNPAEPFVLAPPKSTASRRIIRLAPVAVEALRAHKVRQAAEKLRAGRRWANVSDLVFTTSTGGPLSPNTVRWVLAEGQKAAGVRPFPFHSFRRFAATVIGAAGDMKSAQALLGHRSESLTADVYARVTEQSMERAAAIMQEALG